MTFQELKEKNPHITISKITDASFQKYGNIIEGYDFADALQALEQKDTPELGNIYVAEDPDFMRLPVICELQEGFYGHMPIQAGYCNGGSSKLNALEYHKGTEIDVAGTDLVLLLSATYQIRNNTLASSEVEGFYLPAGTAVELFGTTLHFAPCKVWASGFKSIIILPKGTNSPLDALPVPKSMEDKLLWMQNKWLIAHKESVPASKGACVGITGDNIEIYY